ncbi:MAG: hypothetical protein KJN66_05640 [Bacteroidia bacterium]|nr:hypothetical protein [Bacteroidia bacterium]
MKIIIHILSLIALGLIIYNLTKVDFNAPFHGESVIGIITIIAALCAILLLQILRVSKKIEQKNRY